MSMFEKNIGIVRRRKNGGASAGKGVVFRHMLVAAGVFVGGFTLAGTGSAAVVPTNDYKINFLIDPDGTLLNPPELVHMTLTTDTMLHSGIGAFMGYQVLAISGNSNGDAIGGPLALEFAPPVRPSSTPTSTLGHFLLRIISSIHPDIQTEVSSTPRGSVFSIQLAEISISWPTILKALYPEAELSALGLFPNLQLGS